MGSLAAALTCFLVRRKHESTTSPGTRECSRQLEALGRLTGELAHEIKNPLSTIKVNLKLTQEQLERMQDANARRALRKISIIQAETDRLDTILDDFLHYVGKTELQTERVNINEMVTDLIDFYSPQAHSHKITLRQGLDPQPIYCKLDVGMFKQVLLNIFVNAQQAMPQGGDLMVLTRQENGWAVIQVNDTGSGIKTEHLQRIFEPYYSTRAKGSGLGLPTAKKIVEAHQGLLQVDSELGRGSSFTIRLPLCILTPLSQNKVPN